jgi:hypothetical protein
MKNAARVLAVSLLLALVSCAPRAARGATEGRCLEVRNAVSPFTFGALIHFAVKV